MTISKKMTILEVLQIHPRAREVLVKHGMGCIACMGATMETIESGARMHGVDPETVVKEINALLASSK
ncbi:MAG: DUF1858 domain-containing protein [Firmicutes bacterium]|nr:DUF1858 domain-containing protein [Bacillota bacterium]